MADLLLDNTVVVRVDTQVMRDTVSKYGIYHEQLGVMVAGRVDCEVRYCWVQTGGRQMAAPNVVLAGEDAPQRMDDAHAKIREWLKAQGMTIRDGSYSMPSDLRLMLGAADCLRA